MIYMLKYNQVYLLVKIFQFSVCVYTIYIFIYYVVLMYRNFLKVILKFLSDSFCYLLHERMIVFVTA